MSRGGLLNGWIAGGQNGVRTLHFDCFLKIPFTSLIDTSSSGTLTRMSRDSVSSISILISVGRPWADSRALASITALLE